MLINFEGERIVFSGNSAWTARYSHSKMNMDNYLSPLFPIFISINSKKLIQLKVRDIAIKISGENIEVNICDLDNPKL